MIEFISGNIFESECQALVNPVNCVGISGKGLALAFKQKYPEMFVSYQEACVNKQLVIGQLHIWYGDKIIINFPTKIHWRNPSKLVWIEQGLVELSKQIRNLRISSLALPAIGAGLGGLPIEQVKEKIIEFSKGLEDIKIVAYNL